MTSSMTYIIDDDVDARRSLKFFLEASEVSCRCFSSAEDFLKVVENLEAGCIVTDFHMPGMSGLDLADELLKRAINWPMILMTGRSDFSSSAEIMSEKGMTLLLKPYQNKDLIEAIIGCKFSLRT